jgi:hypothetical protein
MSPEMVKELRALQKENARFPGFPLPFLAVVFEGIQRIPLSLEFSETLNTPSRSCSVWKERASLAISWTNPNAEARNKRATKGLALPTVRLRLAFGLHHKSNNISH